MDSPGHSPPRKRFRPITPESSHQKSQKVPSPSKPSIGVFLIIYLSLFVYAPSFFVGLMKGFL